MNPNFKTLSVKKEIDEKIEFLARAQGKSKSKIIEETFGTLFEVGINFPKNINVENEISILNHSVVFRFSGKSNLQVGIMSEEEMERLRARQFSEAKESIKDAKAKLCLWNEKKDGAK